MDVFAILIVGAFFLVAAHFADKEKDASWEKYKNDIIQGVKDLN